MLRIIEAEIKKLYSSKMWWIIIVGSTLPGSITYLSLLKQANLSWQVFVHVAMLIFNVQSLLTFSAFAAYLYAREYESNTLEVTLCYPYPKHYFLTAKLIIMFLVIGFTVTLFAISTLCFGVALISPTLQTDMLWQFIKIFLQITIMHFLLVPATFLIAIISHLAVSGVILGIVNMCLCMILYNTSFIQFIPPCVPFVLSDHLLGMDVMKIAPNYSIHWSILIIYFVLMLTISFIVSSKARRINESN